MSQTLPSHDPDASDIEPRELELDLTVKAGRLDKVLAQRLPEHSRSRLQGWIERGLVQVNGKPATVRQIVGPMDVLTIWEEASPESLAYTPESVPFDVLAQSDDWIVVNKPVGLVVHPGAGNWQGTLLNGLLYRYPELAQVPRAGIVHRLDKDTSGLMVVARNEIAQTALVRQLQARSVGRRYVALVSGHLKSEGTISRPIGRDPRVPVRMSVERPIAAKPAITHFRPLRQGHLPSGMPVTEVACRLETGRTHQIRVHLASLGHPLLADVLYGGKALDVAGRQMLHARRLQFEDPATQQTKAFAAPLPADMEAVLAQVTWLQAPDPSDWEEEWDDDWDDEQD